MYLQPGLSDDALLSKIIRYHQLHTKSERALGYYLLDFNRRRLFRKHGCSGTSQFAYLKLQLPSRKTRELLRVARALENLPKLDESFATGKISWSSVREISRVAVPETEDQWVEFAKRSSIRRIEQTVSRTNRGDAPCRDAYALTQSKMKVVAELAPEDYAVWETAFARIASLASQEDGPLDASRVLMVLAQCYLEKPMADEEKEKRNAFQVVYHRCTDCETAWLQNVDGPEGIPASKVDERKKVADVTIVENRQNDPRGSWDVISDDAENSQKDKKSKSLHENNKRADQSLSRGSSTVPQDLRDRPNTPVIRNRVLMRDGNLCAAPGCNNRADLNVHHRIWRSRGGKTQESNLLCLCRGCHSLIHNGLLSIEEKINPITQELSLAWVDHAGNEILKPSILGSCDKPIYNVSKAPTPIEQNANKSGELINLMTGEIILPADDIIYSLDEVPDFVDAKWWRKYGHNFRFKGKSNRVVLKSV